MVNCTEIDNEQWSFGPHEIFDIPECGTHLHIEICSVQKSLSDVLDGLELCTLVMSKEFLVMLVICGPLVCIFVYYLTLIWPAIIQTITKLLQSPVSGRNCLCTLSDFWHACYELQHYFWCRVVECPSVPVNLCRNTCGRCD